MKSLKRRSFLFLAFLGLCAVLWLVTWWIGAPQVQRLTVTNWNERKRSYYSERPWVQPPASGAIVSCKAVAYAPFIVQSELGEKSTPGAIEDSGQSVLYLWVLGYTYRIQAAVWTRTGGSILRIPLDG